MVVSVARCSVVVEVQNQLLLREFEVKPLNKPLYSSIGHLPGSCCSGRDRFVNAGQSRILTVEAPKNYKVFVREKLDGTCVGVLKQGGKLLALQRNGYLCSTSPYAQHEMFDEWVKENELRFHRALDDGERMVGEWLVQAHGTQYQFKDGEEVFVPFDVFNTKNERLSTELFMSRCYDADIRPARLLHAGGAVDPAELYKAYVSTRYNYFSRIVPVNGDACEGLVYRCERRDRYDKVAFIAKWVRPGYVPGKYLPVCTGKSPVWNCDIRTLFPIRNTDPSV